jgi:hypothetical protein
MRWEGLLLAFIHCLSLSSFLDLHAGMPLHLHMSCCSFLQVIVLPSRHKQSNQNCGNLLETGKLILYGSLRTLKFCFKVFDNSLLAIVYCCHIIPTPRQHVFSSAQPYK